MGQVSLFGSGVACFVLSGGAVVVMGRLKKMSPHVRDTVQGLRIRALHRKP